MFAHTISDFSYNSRVIYQYNPIAGMLDEGICTLCAEYRDCKIYANLQSALPYTDYFLVRRGACSSDRP